MGDGDDRSFVDLVADLDMDLGDRPGDPCRHDTGLTRYQPANNRHRLAQGLAANLVDADLGGE